MMISPEGFVEMQKSKSYEELLEIRDELLDEIVYFEEHPDQPVLMMPSPDVIYKMNLRYLGKLCELIAEKYDQEFVRRNE